MVLKEVYGQSQEPGRRGAVGSLTPGHGVTTHLHTVQQPHSWVLTQEKWNRCPHKHLYVKVYSGFIYNHFVTSQNRKATSEWINKLQHIQTTDYYPALQRKRLLIHATTITVPSERGQTQMAGCFHLLWKRQHYRDREQDQWLQGLGVGGGGSWGGVAHSLGRSRRKLLQWWQDSMSCL